MPKPETIGSLIQRLFPFGFAQDVTHFLLSAGPTDNKKREHLMKKLIAADLTNRESLDAIVEKSIEKDQRLVSALEGLRQLTEHALIENKRKHKASVGPAEISPDYLAPPSTPFDLFAITSTLLAKSGAYHHFEPEVDWFGADSDKLRQLKRVCRVSKEKRQEWCRCGQYWHDVDSIVMFYTRKMYYAEQYTDFAEFVRSIAISPAAPATAHREFSEEEKEKHRAEGRAFFEIWRLWLKLLCNWNKPVFRAEAEQESPPDWWEAAYALTAIADEASRDAGFKFHRDGGPEIKIWARLAHFLIVAAGSVKDTASTGEETLGYVESLSFAVRSIVAVMPKSKTAPIGCTIRGVTHNLASLPGTGSIRVGWAWTKSEPSKQASVFNLLLVPYPYVISSSNFVSLGYTADPAIRSGTFGISVYSDPRSPVDSPFFEFFENLLSHSKEKVGAVHGIVFPEMALTWASTQRLIDRCAAEPSVELVCAGVREHPFKYTSDDTKAKANGAFMAAYGLDESGRRAIAHKLFHEKHHRWRLNEEQILNYNLSASLDPSRVWWEDLRVVNRKLPFLVIRDKWVVTTLICEDLARNDPTRPVVESIGPNLIISLLMDGPQLKSRWSARYASVLAEDPGSAVLSMTSFGLIARSNEQSLTRQINASNEAWGSRVFALWRDHRQTREIELGAMSHAVILSLTEYPSVDQTLDGRLDIRATSVALTGIKQITAPNWLSEDGASVRYPPWHAPRNSR